MSDHAELTPQSYLYQRARQIQEEILPQIDTAIKDLERQRLIFKTEFQVLEAASTALPPELIPASELGIDEEQPFLPGLDPAGN